MVFEDEKNVDDVLMIFKDKLNARRQKALFQWLEPLSEELDTAQRVTLEIRKEMMKQLITEENAKWVKELEDLGLSMWNQQECICQSKEEYF